MIAPNKLTKVAIVGATPNKEKYGNIVMHNLAKKGFVVYPVSPKYDEIDGFKTYKSITELPKDVELIIFIVPPSVGIEEVKKAYDSGFRKFWFQPGAESVEIVNYLKFLGDCEFVYGRCIMVETTKKE